MTQSTLPADNSAEVRKRLEWIANARWDDNADLDALCTYAEQALDSLSAPAPAQESYPNGVTSADHIAHDIRMGRFPNRSTTGVFLAERASTPQAAPEVGDIAGTQEDQTKKRRKDVSEDGHNCSEIGEALDLLHSGGLCAPTTCRVREKGCFCTDTANLISALSARLAEAQRVEAAADSTYTHWRKLGEARKALAVFIRHYEPWMDDHGDECRKVWQAQAQAAEAEVARCHARLEIDHAYVNDEKREIPMDERATWPDAVYCRDATIALQDKRIASLEAELERLKAGLQKIDDMEAWATSHMMAEVARALAPSSQGAEG